MAKNYRKVGQTDHYAPVKQNGYGQIIGGIIVVVITLALLGQCSAQGATPPLPDNATLRADDQGVLWHVPGQDGTSPLTQAIKLSYNGEGFVIFVATSQEHKEQAIAHAIKLQKWFAQSKHTSKHIPIVAYDMTEDGVFYRFYLDGVSFDDDIFGPMGNYSPQNSIKVLDKVLKTYRASMVLKAQSHRVNFGMEEEN